MIRLISFFIGLFATLCAVLSIQLAWATPPGGLKLLFAGVSLIALILAMGALHIAIFGIEKKGDK